MDEYKKAVGNKSTSKPKLQLTGGNKLYVWQAQNQYKTKFSEPLLLSQAVKTAINKLYEQKSATEKQSFDEAYNELELNIKEQIDSYCA